MTSMATWIARSVRHDSLVAGQAAMVQARQLPSMFLSVHSDPFPHLHRIGVYLQVQRLYLSVLS